jgi:aryl-alcohol dehydrogenase-like predicted oxidoreductase
MRMGKEVLSRCGLGTAQFGMFYGAFNAEGVPSRETVKSILKKAGQLGLSLVDTARQYGESELALGHCSDELQNFDVITKTPKFSDGRISATDARMLRESFEISLQLLHIPSVYGLLIHHAPDLLAPGGDLLYEELLQLKNEGRVRRIGVSIYTGEVAESIIEKFPLDLIQLPVNVLDRRLLDKGVLSRLARNEVEIHARSVFLQGLLLADPETLTSRFESVRGTLRAFHATARRAGISPAHAALHYVLRIPEISRVIVGVESITQMCDLFCDFPEKADMDFSEFRADEIEILNPSFWVQ